MEDDYIKKPALEQILSYNDRGAAVYEAGFHEVDTEDDIIEELLIEQNFLYDETTVNNIKYIIDDYIDSNSLFLCENLLLSDIEYILDFIATPLGNGRAS